MAPRRGYGRRWRRAAGLWALWVLATAGRGSAPASAAVTPEEEKAAGRRIAAQVESYFGALDDPARLGRVTAIGRRLEKAAVIPPGKVTWRLIDSPQFNALAIPGDRVYVARGLVDGVGSDRELAAAMAHELSHILLGHTRQLMEEHSGRRRITLVVENPAADGRPSRRVVVSEGPQAAAGTREKELAADREALSLLRKAGYPPEAALAMLAHLDRPKGGTRNDGETLQDNTQSILSSHPSPAERIRLVQGYLAAVARRGRTP